MIKEIKNTCESHLKENIKYCFNCKKSICQNFENKHNENNTIKITTPDKDKITNIENEIMKQKQNLDALKYNFPSFLDKTKKLINEYPVA